jgi:hypothetical protein
MTRARFGLRVGILLLLPTAALGCSYVAEPPQIPVGTLEGKVTLDSKPVLAGFVCAVPLDTHTGVPARGVIRQDGAYTIENAPGGPVRLYLEPPPMPPELNPLLKHHFSQPPHMQPGKRGGDKEAPTRPELEGVPEELQKAWASLDRIPKHYFSAERTTVMAVVNPGDTTQFDIRLSSRAFGPPDPNELPGGPPGPGGPPRP